MNNEDYSLALLGDALFEVLHNSDIPAETIVEKIRDTLQDSENYLETRLDRTRDVLRYFSDDGLSKEEMKETVSGLDFTDGYEWTPLSTSKSLSDMINTKSPYYWDTNRNR